MEKVKLEVWWYVLRNADGEGKDYTFILRWWPNPMFLCFVRIDNIKFAIWNLTSSEVMDVHTKGGGPTKAKQNERPPSQLVVNAKLNPSFS